MSLPEQQLRDRLIAGDETALAEVYDAFGAVVYRLASHVTRDWTAAQDVTQEVFVYVWEHPARFNPDRGGLRSWLSVMAYRRAVDWVRREVTQQRHRERAATDDRDPDPPPGEQAITSWSHERIRRAVEALPTDQRTAVRLAYFEGHTFRSVATALGIPEGTAKSRLRTGLAALRRRLGAEGLP
jgi:RNA polymerase sigma-70 factor (ECF subfamily)